MNATDRLTRRVGRFFVWHSWKMQASFAGVNGRIELENLRCLRESMTHLDSAQDRHDGSDEPLGAAIDAAARWAACSNAVPSEATCPVYPHRDATLSPQVLTCGDDAGAKVVAGDLFHKIGFEPLEPGSLRTARFATPPRRSPRDRPMASRAGRRLFVVSRNCAADRWPRVRKKGASHEDRSFRDGAVQQGA